MRFSDKIQVGPLGAWLAQTVSGGDIDVPCGDCTACCRSSQFVHVGPEEYETLAAIPNELLFPAPGRPAGWKVMGYDSEGRCPMLGEKGCTIYERRPVTCRTFDCRIFAAAGLVERLEDEAPAISEAARRWVFETGGDANRRAEELLRREAVGQTARQAAGAAIAAARVQAERSSSAMEASTPLTKRPDSSVE